MNRTNLIFFLLIFFGASSSSFANTYLKASELPKDFLNTPLDLNSYPTSVDTNLKDNNDFITYTHNNLTNYLQSGSVIWNPFIQKYLNNIVDKILIEKPNIRTKLKIHINKSPYANAFASANGFIIVNIGLLARVNSEAQLAFVLSHEIAHYISQHSLKGYIENKKVLKTKKFNEINNDKILPLQQKNSRKQEREADSLGMELFVKSGYSAQYIEAVFDILKYGEWPFSSSDIDMSSFMPSIKLHGQLYTPSTEIKTISDTANFDDLSSHEDYATRKKNLINFKKVQDSLSTSFEYLNGKNDFYKVKEKANSIGLSSMPDFYEFSYTLFELKNKSLETLSEKDHELLVKSLYLLNLSKKKSSFLKAYKKQLNKMPNHISPLFTLIDNLSQFEFSIFAIRNIFESFQLFPKNAIISQVIKLSIAENITNHKDKWKYVIKNSKLRYKEGETYKTYDLPDDMEEKINSDIAVFLFDIVNDTNYLALAEKAEAISKQADFNKKFEGSLDLDDDTKIDMDLSTPDLVIVNPNIIEFDNRSNGGYNLKNKKTKEIDFYKKLNDISHSLDLNSRTLTPRHMTKDSVGLFNDLVSLQKYYELRKKSTQPNELFFLKDESKSLVQKYKTPYFCWMSTVELTSEQSTDEIYSLMKSSFWILPKMPYNIYQIFQPAQKTFLFANVLNIETGKLVYTRKVLIPEKSNHSLYSQFIYDILSQIRN